jgi:hypothetical protein
MDGLQYLPECTVYSVYPRRKSQHRCATNFVENFYEWS